MEVASWSAHKDNPHCSVAVDGGLPGYVKLNGNVILNKSSCGGVGPEPSRGIHIQLICLIDPFNCSKIQYTRYDPFADEAEAEKMGEYLDQLGDFSVIVGSMGYDAFELARCFHALLRVGVDLSNLEDRGSYAFVTQKSTNKTVKTQSNTEEESHKNPARVNVIITGMHRGVSIYCAKACAINSKHRSCDQLGCWDLVPWAPF